MAKDWAYSLQSKISKESGGPEKYAEKLMNIGRAKGKIEGLSEGKKSMIPWLGVTFIAGSVITGIVVKVANRLKTKTKDKNSAELTDEQNIE